jgi:hypothetical protein
MDTKEYPFWIVEAANEIASHWPSFGGRNEDYDTRRRETQARSFADIIQKYLPVTEPPLLQCITCNNTESCAGAMARLWMQGRCMHCGGFFRVVRA